jgi:hypothetical protein
MYNDGSLPSPFAISAQAAQDAEVQAHKAAVDRLRRGADQRSSGVLQHLASASAPVRQKQPLDFLAIGDSWFYYPLNGSYPLQNTAIVASSQLGAMGNPPPRILNKAFPGQSTIAMLSYKKQAELRDLLLDPSQWVSGRPDAILVSAGGDNIAGDQFAIYLDYGGTTGLDQARFQGLLDDVQASYFDLFAFRDLFAKGVPIVGHCYDYALPTGVAALPGMGPWLQPSLDFAGYDYSVGVGIIRKAIGGFQDLMKKLAADQLLPPGKTTNNFIMVDTPGTLTPDSSQTGWSNELHPWPTGFNALAKGFLAKLQARFPGQI